MLKFLIYSFILGVVLVKSKCADTQQEAVQWICKDRLHGDLIPHPEDCHSYFVCDRNAPKLVICYGNLHFDPKQRVCNWPEAANCKLGEYPPYWEITPRPIISTIYPVTNKSITSESNTSNVDRFTTTKIQKKTTYKPKTTTVISSTECNTQPSVSSTRSQSKNSSIGSIDEDGKDVDPMKTYDPKKVQCLYNGLYFLPHPGDCQKYFICANHILYLHNCGVYANWNYKAERCDYKDYAQCYFDENSMQKTTKRKRITSKVPTKKITETVATSEYSTTLKNDKEYIPECPTNKQKFIPHPTDCTKYYICIYGKAALTNCPEGLWWDEREQWCGQPDYSFCKAAKKKN